MGTSGFGKALVSGRRRVPRPAAKIIAPVVDRSSPAMATHSPRPRAARQLSLALLAALAWALGAACSDPASTQGTCERVEAARCAFPSCAANGAAFGPSGDCAAYAKSACEGGTAAGVAPSPEAEAACVTAIRAAGAAGSCASVRAPSTLPECGFLALPRDAGAEGGG